MKRDYVPVQWSDDDALWEAMAPALSMEARFAIADRDVEEMVRAAAWPPHSRVLDLGCGAGVHAVAFAARGFDVTGVDRSETLLAIAQRAAAERNLSIAFENADMREFVRRRAFDLACSLYSSFGYFDDESNERVLRNLYDTLRPGGSLILDVLGRWDESASFGDYAVVRHRDGDRLIEEWTICGKPFRTLQRLYEPAELDRLLSGIGFKGLRPADVLGGTLRRITATK